MGDEDDPLSTVRRSVVEAATRELYLRHLDWSRARREAVQLDLDRHLEFLRVALKPHLAEVFPRYARWCVSVLEARGLPRALLIESFGVLSRQLAARLPSEEYTRTAEVLEQGRRALLDAGPIIGETELGEPLPAFAALAEALAAGDRRRVEELVCGPLKQGMALPELGDRLVRPAMAEVGRLWRENLLTTTQEHLATALMQMFLASVFFNVPVPRVTAQRALFACVEGNQHCLGPWIVASTFELAGWEVQYLGADVPTRDLLGYVERWEPHLLGLSLSMPQDIVTAERVIRLYRSELGHRCPRILVGGLAATEFTDAVEHLGAEGWATSASLALERAAVLSGATRDTPPPAPIAPPG